MNLQQAKSIKGYLQKKSTGLMGWQKRYYFIVETEHGISLLYQDKENDKAPKGEIKIDEIISITRQNDKQFNIIHPQRIFEMEAKNKAETD